MDLPKSITKMSFSIDELAKSSRNSNSEQPRYDEYNLVTEYATFTTEQRKRKRSSGSDDSSSTYFDSSNSDHDSPVMKKRNRTMFTNSQLVQLEMYYSTNKYLQIEDRPVLAKRLKLSQTQIKWWFQNRRMKEKRVIKSGDHSGAKDMSMFVGIGKRPAVDVPTQHVPSYYQQPNHVPYSHPSYYQQSPGSVFNPYVYWYMQSMTYPFYSGAQMSPIQPGFTASPTTP